MTTEEKIYVNTIDKVNIFDFEYTAGFFFKQFLRENDNNIYKVDMANKVAYTKDGVAHWFMGDYTYRIWCRGRTYLWDEDLYRSGYPLRSVEK